MKRVWRGAIVGFGEVARRGHLPAWRASDDFSIVAVVDADPERRELAHRCLPGVEVFPSCNELWHLDALDFVDIAVPPTFHAELAKAALVRGVAVLCEKPLATNWSDYRELAEVSQRRNVPLHTVHNWRHSTAYRTIRALLRSGRLGPVRKVVIQVERDGCASGSAGDWRLLGEVAGGGILADHGWHAFYLALGFLGQFPRAVRALADRRRYAHAEVEDTASCRIEFPRGAAEIDLTWAGSRRFTAWRIEGEHGEIVVEEGELRFASGRTSWARPIPSLSCGSHHPEWFGGVLAEFRSALCNPRASNLVLAGWCAALLAQAYRSIRSGGATVPVSLSALANGG